MATKEKDLQEIGRRAFECLAEMVSALECDYERLEELKQERADWYEENPGKFLHVNDPRDGGRWALACPDEAEELADLIKSAGECESREDAETRISEDPLSVEVRSDWVTLGEEMTAEEFCILLATGGPAVRIIGQLDSGEPYSARLEAQDWFTPWTPYHDADEETLLTYARQFYFGE